MRSRLQGDSACQFVKRKRSLNFDQVTLTLYSYFCTKVMDLFLVEFKSQLNFIILDILPTVRFSFFQNIFRRSFKSQ